jgi:FdhE protein
MISEVAGSAAVAVDKVNEALDALRKDLVPLENVIEAFRHVLSEKARLKAELPFPETGHTAAFDEARFQQGVSLFRGAELIDFPPHLWTIALDRIIPALELGFPKLKEAIAAIKHGLEAGKLDGQKFLRALMEGDSEGAEGLVRSIGADLRTVGFVMGQVAKPLVEKRAQALEPLIRDLSWNKGYCPLCGSMPEISFLQGDEGQRWLKCSFCSHEWRFARLVCPFCESDDHANLLVHYIAGREEERVEACNGCHRYVLSIDLRQRPDRSVLDVAAIGLVHLDVIAQQKGLLPAAWCAWNLVSGDDISIAPVTIGAKGPPI